jgi:16S rRNA (uracil1498-N3)-methyltransferase
MSSSKEKPDELFFTPKECIGENELCIEGQESIHCTKVLRKKVGDQIWVCDAEHSFYEVQIQTIQKSSLEAKILRRIKQNDELTQNFPILVIGKLKQKDRLEWLVEKAVELGVAEIHFVDTQRTERSHLNLERLKMIAIAAMKQSKRASIPRLVDSSDLLETVKKFVKNYPIWLAHEKLDAKDIAWADLQKRCVLVVGPEGGFSEYEVSSIASLTHVSLVQLGEWRLRAETAALHLVSAAAFVRLQHCL